ncbi:ferredoxin [Longispora sp. NPDC051575]|uniref:ferredoxin n=1 Tax=Longispora sp. NPDC051575 TaxID=3154943 RepID=UPI0034373F16
MTAQWQVSVDGFGCIGSGMCAASAPDFFELDGRGRSRALHEKIDPDERVLDAAVSCPVEAISLVDLATGEEVPLD